ncbi:MAG: hypothetical protein D6759_10190 [Chloroflexi bacterium]|nr:MAG: hypothetical protein D6759_10190 [Chloroflexota bacterium]
MSVAGKPFSRLAQGHPASCRETRERAGRFLRAQQVPGLPVGVVTTAEMAERDRELEEIAEAILTRGESPRVGPGKGVSV